MLVCRIFAEVVLGLSIGQVAPNAPWFQDIPSYVTDDWGKSVTHPDVVRFDTAWNGWKYWIVYTPYPMDLYENPSIAVSRDGANWEVPQGLTNPIVEGPGPERTNFHHNCDPDMVYDGDRNLLRVYFNRTYNDDYAEIMSVESTDGVHWTAPQKLFGMSPNPLSPTVVRVNGTWYMWYTNSGQLQRRQSADGVTWSEPENTNTWLPSEKSPWHQDVIYVDSVSEYWMAMTTHPDFTVYFLRSKDGLVWDTLLEPLIGPGIPGAWDGDHPYRASLFWDKVESRLRIWYSAWGESPLQGEKKIGYTEVSTHKVLDGSFVSADGNIDGLIVADPVFMEVVGEGGTRTAAVTCGNGVGQWSAKVTEGGEWLTILSDSEGTGNGQIIIQCGANAGIGGRTGKISIESGEAENSPVEVEIHQSWNPCAVSPLLVSVLPGFGFGFGLLRGSRDE